MESKLSWVAQGQGSPTPTPQNMNYSNNLLHPAVVGRVAQHPLTLAHIMPASGQPQRPGRPGVAGHFSTSAATPQLAARPPQTAFLPPGSTIPPNMALIKTERGMFIVPHHVLAQIQAKAHQGQMVPNILPRPATPPAPAALPAFRVCAPLHPAPGMAGGKNPVSMTAQANQKLSDLGGETFRDDINDVASMAGINVNEENARILAASSDLVGTKIRSCKDESFLPTGPLQRRILQITRKLGVSEVPAEVVNFISDATQCRLRGLLEKVSAAARHRTDGCMAAEGGPYERSSDVRAQLCFFKQLDSVKKQRLDEQERDTLLKAARSRTKKEDAQQAFLKQKAKQMWEQELALIRQNDANLAALNAIGPRKKRKLDLPPAASAADSEVASSKQGPRSSAAITALQTPRKQVTRVNRRDLIFCVEQERPRSLLLYKAQLG